MSTSASYLGLEGLHVLVTGATDDVGYHAVKEFLGMCALYGPSLLLFPDR